MAIRKDLIANASKVSGSYAPPPDYDWQQYLPEWYNSPIQAGYDWGALGAGYTGAPRAPGEPNPTGRFEWQKPGAGLEYAKLSNEAAARAFMSNVAKYGMPASKGISSQTNALANLMSGGIVGPGGGTAMYAPGMTPQTAGQNLTTNMSGLSPNAMAALASRPNTAAAIKEINQYTSPDGKTYVGGYDQGKNNYVAQAMEMTGMTIDQLRKLKPEQAAFLMDRVMAAREFENQKPKRGLQVGPFNIHPAALVGGALGAFFPAGASGLIAGGIGGGASGGWKGALLGGGLGYFGSGGTIAGHGVGDLLPSSVTDWWKANNPFGGKPTIGGVNPNDPSMVGYFGNPNLSGTAQGSLGPGYLNPGVSALGGGVSGLTPLVPNLGTVAQGSLGSNFLNPGLVNANPGIGVPGANPLTPNLSAIGQTGPSMIGNAWNSWSNLPAVGIGAGSGTTTGSGGAGGANPIALLPPPPTGTTGGTGTGTDLSPFYNEMANVLGPQAGIGAKTKPGTYFNVLGNFPPRSIFGYA